MRNLQRNCRKIYFSVPEAVVQIFDEYGNDTLEVEKVYTEPQALYVNVSANVGQDVVNTFGSFTEYNRTITYSAVVCPLSEGTRVWLGVEPTEAHNYQVVKVSDSKNGFLIALREVSTRG